MAARIHIDLPVERQTRTELTLSRVAKAWSETERGRRFVQPLLDFLRSLPSQETLRAYSYSILEMFSWYERERGRIPSPPELTRADAATYARWLGERSEGLTGWRLEKDPQRQTDLIIHEFLRKRPGAGIDDIRKDLLRYHWLGVIGPDGRPMLKMDHEAGGMDVLSKHLSCLVGAKTVRRLPTIDQLRRLEVVIPNWPPEAQRAIGFTVEPPSNIFRYWTIEQTTGASERSSTTSLRMTALSSLWTYFQTAGDNLGGEPLLAHNVWKEPLSVARSQVSTQQAASRADKTPESSLVIRMLATTFPALGDRAMEAAKTVLFGGAVDEPDPTFADIRDRALILFMVQAGGPRVAEATRLQKRDIAGEPPIVTIIGKRNRKRQLRVPPAAMAALHKMWWKLEKLAQHQNRYYSRSRAEILLLDDESPLFPVISHWGANRHANSLAKLSRQAVAMMLRRRAMAAGVQPGDPLFARVHPHGLRHLFAQMTKATTPLTKIQAMMGHTSLTTTGRYLEERAPESLIADVFTQAPPMAPYRTAHVIPEERVEPVSERPLPRLPEVVRTRRGPTPEPAPARPAETATEGRLEPTRAALQAEPDTGKAMVEVSSEDGEPSVVQEEVVDEALYATLDDIYDHNWGERGQRTRLADPGGAKAVGFGGADFSEMDEETIAVLTGGGIPELESVGEPTRLVHSYLGRSRLIWWAGTNGELTPEMPVLSRRQVGSCDAHSQSELCQGLLDLWHKWFQEDPSASAALVKWISQAIETAAQVDRALGGATWISTNEEPGPADVREHDIGRVLQWFQNVAWNYRESRGREEDLIYDPTKKSPRPMRVIGKPLVTPEWFGEVDPIANMPMADRLELLDLIGVLTVGVRHRMLDTTRRYGAWSRADIASFMAAMSDYDDAVDRLAREKLGSKVSGDPEAAAKRREVHLKAVEVAEDSVAKLASDAGAKDFDIRTEAKQRRAKRQVKRESRGDFYLRMVGVVYGQAASVDPLLTMYAKTIPSMAGHKLGGSDVGEGGGKAGKKRSDPVLGDYANMFTIDRRLGTLRHSDDLERAYTVETGIVRDNTAGRTSRDRYGDALKRLFAEETGTHSECVARRIARQLWELWNANNSLMIDVAKLIEKGVSRKDATNWVRGQRMTTEASVSASRAAVEAGVQRYQLPEHVAAFDRRDYVASLVVSMMAYRIPCPSAQASELRALLADRTPSEVYETWRRHTGGKFAPDFDEPQSEIEAAFSAAGSPYSGAQAAEAAAHGRTQAVRNPAARATRYTLNAARRLPSPILLIVAARMR